MSEKGPDAGPETGKYPRYLLETDVIREKINRDILLALELPQGSQGLDLGCGAGAQALMLADAVGPKGRVTGLDNNPEFVAHARAMAADKGLSERVLFQEGDCQCRLPFDDEAFDWVWSADFLGYRSLSSEVTRVIRPGGSLIILFWSSEQLLPGYPLLESKLKATTAGLAPFKHGSRPETHPLRCLKRLTNAGLVNAGAMTFVSSVHAPLSRQMRQAMKHILKMRWPGVEPELSKEDLDLYQRLTDPASPDFILNLPDYYAFFTYSVFRGRVPTD